MTTKRRKRHNPEQMVRKLRDADAMLHAGKDQAAALQSLDISRIRDYGYRLFGRLVPGHGRNCRWPTRGRAGLRATVHGGVIRPLRSK